MFFRIKHHPRHPLTPPLPRKPTLLTLPTTHPRPPHNNTIPIHRIANQRLTPLRPIRYSCSTNRLFLVIKTDSAFDENDGTFLGQRVLRCRVSDASVLYVAWCIAGFELQYSEMEDEG